MSERELLRLARHAPGPRARGRPASRARTDARAWYAEHGRPFAASRRIDVKRVSASVVRLADGSALRSEALADGLRATRGHAVVVLAVSAGREVAAEASRLWASDRPDEAYFLDRFAAAVTEALVLWAAGAECRAASEAGETLLPPLSPGCGRFEIGDQQCLARALGALPSGRADPQEGEREAGAGRLRLGPLELLATAPSTRRTRCSLRSA